MPLFIVYIIYPGALVYTNIYLGGGTEQNVYINEEEADALCIFKVGLSCICVFVYLYISVHMYLYVYKATRCNMYISMRRRGQMHCVFIRWGGFVFTARGH